MNDLRQDSQTGLPKECFALCSENFETSCFSRSVLIGTPVDFKRFYLEKGSVPSTYVKRKIHWTLIIQEMREDLQIDFFPKKHFFGTLPRNVSVQNPLPQKKFDFFSDWVGLFETCFRSSKMTDPRPCPTGWAYFRALSCSAKTSQAHTNNKLSTAKSICLRGQRNITGQNTPSQTSIGRFSEKNQFVLCLP